MFGLVQGNFQLSATYFNPHILMWNFFRIFGYFELRLYSLGLVGNTFLSGLSSSLINYFTYKERKNERAE